MPPRRTPNRTNQPQELDLSSFDNQLEGQQTLNQSQTPFATAQTPVQEPAFTIDVDQDITSDLLEETTAQDVFDFRAGAEAEAATVQAGQDATTNAQTLLDTPEDSLFADPTSEITSILNADPTEAETEYQNLLTQLADEARGIDESLTAARERGEQNTGLFDLQKELNQTNTKIANRQATLRRRLRDFDRSAEARGVARQFVQDERRKIEADATAELADLYIIQNAQQGNVQAAEKYINTAVENKYKNIETELAARQFELQAAESRLKGEEKDENLRLQLALSERQNQIADRKEQEKSLREFAITAAQNGAPSNLVEQIMQTGNVEAGLAMASPYIGRYDRMKAELSLANSRLSRRKQLTELALAGDEQAIKELGAFGLKLTAGQEIQEELAEYQRQGAITNEVLELETMLNSINFLKESEDGRGLATGEFRSPYLRAAGVAVPAGAGAGAVAGSVVPGLGTAIGTGLGTISGIGTSIYRGAQLANEKQDFLNQAKFVSENVSFAKFIDLKSQGVAFGGTAVAELRKVDAAASALSASLISDPVTGEAIRISGSEQEFLNNLAIVEQGLNLAKSELQSDRLPEEAKAAILRAYNAQ